MDIEEVWCPHGQVTVTHKAEAHPDMPQGPTDTPTLLILNCSMQDRCKVYELRFLAQFRDKCRIGKPFTAKIEEART